MKTREIETTSRPTQISLSIFGELFRTYPSPECPDRPKEEDV